jgi:hypothetical protein
MRGAGSGAGCLSRTHEFTNRPFRPVVAKLWFANTREKERDQSTYAMIKQSYINKTYAKINKAVGRKCGQLKGKVAKTNFHIIVSHECEIFLTLRGEHKFKC